MTESGVLVAPVQKSIHVQCSSERAFELFTREIGTWWPTHTYHSIGKDKIAAVVFEEKVGGRIYEQHKDGSEHDWGSVLLWEPPRKFVMRWHPGEDGTRATELEVRFAAEGDGARVDLEHRGWEIYAADASETRSNYNSGWDEVLGYYTRQFES
jgi:uncharacterized protein YndB with AHSA1/START domain